MQLYVGTPAFMGVQSFFPINTIYYINANKIGNIKGGPQWFAQSLKLKKNT